MNIASFTDVDIASRLPVMSAEAIAPRSPLRTERIRRSRALRMESIVCAARSRNPGSNGGSNVRMRPNTNPDAPMPWK
jgi:hypothetical protein